MQQPDGAAPAAGQAVFVPPAGAVIIQLPPPAKPEAKVPGPPRMLTVRHFEHVHRFPLPLTVTTDSDRKAFDEGIRKAFRFHPSFKYELQRSDGVTFLPGPHLFPENEDVTLDLIALSQVFVLPVESTVMKKRGDDRKEHGQASMTVVATLEFEEDRAILTLDIAFQVRARSNHYALREFELVFKNKSGVDGNDLVVMSAGPDSKPSVLNVTDVNSWSLTPTLSASPATMGVPSGGISATVGGSHSVGYTEDQWNIHLGSPEGELKQRSWLVSVSKQVNTYPPTCHGFTTPFQLKLRVEDLLKRGDRPRLKFEVRGMYQKFLGMAEGHRASHPWAHKDHNMFGALEITIPIRSVRQDHLVFVNASAALKQGNPSAIQRFL